MRIAIIEDDAPTLQALVDTLRNYGHEVEGYATLPLFRPEADVILLDLYLGDSAADETLERAIEMCVAMPIVVLTGDPRPHVHSACVAAGAFLALPKPAPIALLDSVLQQAVAHLERPLRSRRLVIDQIDRLYEMAAAGGG